MSVAHLRKEVSIEEFLAGIEDDELFERCEYWDGEIIPKDPEPGDPMSPINLHAYLQIQPGRRLANYLDEHPVGTVLSEIHTHFRPARRVFLPDIAVVLGEMDVNLEPLRQPPDIAIEIMSPSDKRGARLRRKIEFYPADGVREVWQIDPVGKRAWIHAPGEPVRELGLDDYLASEGLLPGFRIQLRALFPPSKQKS